MRKMFLNKPINRKEQIVFSLILTVNLELNEIMTQRNATIKGTNSWTSINDMMKKQRRLNKNLKDWLKKSSQNKPPRIPSKDYGLDQFSSTKDIQQNKIKILEQKSTAWNDEPQQ